MYACLAVTCHLHFWQNVRDFLCATVVTRGWNGYRNKSQHRKSTLEKKILPPFQQGFEPATFQSRVRCSNHWAIPAPVRREVTVDCFISTGLRHPWGGRKVPKSGARRLCVVGEVRTIRRSLCRRLPRPSPSTMRDWRRVNERGASHVWFLKKNFPGDSRIRLSRGESTPTYLSSNIRYLLLLLSLSNSVTGHKYCVLSGFVFSVLFINGVICLLISS